MTSAGAAEELLAGLPVGAGAEPATAIRSTVVIASRLAIRELGLDEPYFELLDPQHHAVILSVTGGLWLPMEVALAHYTAADGLRLDTEAQRGIGRNVAGRLQDSYAGSIIRSLRATGALSPRNVMAQFPSVWSRLVQGGGSRVVQTGPKDLQVEFLGIPIARLSYVREGWAGMFEGTLSLVSRAVYVHELPPLRSDDGCAFSVSWA